jgi:hypothetical protein
MTRVHFEMIAETINALRPVRPVAYWQEMVRQFGDMCASANPGFNREKFERACGLSEE